MIKLLLGMVTPFKLEMKNGVWKNKFIFLKSLDRCDNA